jgi:hypothetical protein
MLVLRFRVGSFQASLCFLSKAYLDLFQAAMCVDEAVVFCPRARHVHATVFELLLVICLRYLQEHVP